MPEIIWIPNYGEWLTYDSGQDIQNHLLGGKPFYAETRIAVDNVLNAFKQKTPGAIQVPRLLTKDEIQNLPIGSVVTLKAEGTTVEILDKSNEIHSLIVADLKRKRERN